MRKILLGLWFLLGVSLCGCSRFPTLVLGNSSGYLQYDRRTGKLEVTWESNIKVDNTQKLLYAPDSILYDFEKK